MKTNFKKAALLLSGIIAGGQLFAQTPDTTKTVQTFNNYVKPFSPESFSYMVYWRQCRSSNTL